MWRAPWGHQAEACHDFICAASFAAGNQLLKGLWPHRHPSSLSCIVGVNCTLVVILDNTGLHQQGVREHIELYSSCLHVLNNLQDIALAQLNV